MALVATAAPGSACDADEFLCEAGDQCVPVAYHCDGEVDCRDESDERGCSKLCVVISLSMHAGRSRTPSGRVG